MNFEINFKNDKIKCYNIKSNDKKLEQHYICDYDHKKHIIIVCLVVLIGFILKKYHILL